VVLQGASSLMAFLTVLVLARLLHSSGYGRYAVALAWATLLVTPATLGLDRFLVRGIATYETQGQWPLARGLLTRTNQLVALTSTLIACLGAGAAATVVSPQLRWTFAVAMVIIPFTALTVLRQGAMQALGHVVAGQFPEYIIRQVLILGAIGLSAWWLPGQLTATSAAAINVAGVAVAFCVGAWMLRRALPRAIRVSRPEYATRSWLRASLPMMLVAGVTTANTYVAILLVGAIRGAGAAGIYSVVQTGGGLIAVVLMAANMPLAPAVASLYARGDRRGLERAAEGVARAAMLTSLPLVAAFVVVPQVYLQLFGRGFEAGATALLIVALGQLLNVAAGPSGNVLLMTGHEAVALRGILAGLVTNLIVDVALIPKLGVTGAAVGAAMSLCVWNAIFVLIARRRLGVNVTAFKVLSLAACSPEDTSRSDAHTP
jgi:O-antigen/teichoic acid export membrane protein